jgi:hypothetical protein
VQAAVALSNLVEIFLGVESLKIRLLQELMRVRHS